MMSFLVCEAPEGWAVARAGREPLAYFATAQEALVHARRLAVQLWRRGEPQVELRLEGHAGVLWRWGEPAAQSPTV